MDSVLSRGWDKLMVDADQLVKTGQCKLHAITLNGVTVVGDIDIYDGVDDTGTPIARLNVRSAVSVSFQGLTFLFDCRMDNGIFVNFSDSTFAGNITVTFL